MAKNTTPQRIVSGLGPPAMGTPHPSCATHPLPVLALDPPTYARTQDCVQCGLCLPACPTYITTGLEADSPRGRIRLIKGLADGQIQPSPQVTHHLDLCLDCRGCETACPSGVAYHELIEATRAKLIVTPTDTTVAAAADRLIRALALNILPYPHRLKLAALPARVLQKLSLWRLLTQSSLHQALPKRLVGVMRMLPAAGRVWEPPLATHYHAQAPPKHRRGTVGFFVGCVGSVLFQQVNRQSIALLQRAGYDVVVPRTQQCCGAIHHHNGEADQARALAQANLDAFWPTHEQSPRLDDVVNSIAGCGAMLRSYGHLLCGDPAYAKRGQAFADQVRDISQLLVTLDPPQSQHPSQQPAPPPRHRVAYHDACHLAHAQGITAEPRSLLEKIDGLKVVPLPESDLCCGAAGTYSLMEPEMAETLGRRKIQNIIQTGASVCATGNAGCAMQIQAHATAMGLPLRVVHPVTLLHEAYK